ncbi:diguanylate cyclase [Pseudomonas baetica]|uniref:diguanylate cyclase n=1 Tax=Pseudomonas baetica TaxID=674054 RepID=UPI003EE96AB1
MEAPHRSNSRIRLLSVLFNIHPRQTVFLCFALVFAVTIVLAGRQYYLGFERQLNDREHHLQLQAIVIDEAIDNGKNQLRLLGDVAERLLLNDQNAHVETSIDAALQQALQDRQKPVWGLSVPAFDAPVRSISDQQLAAIPGLSRDADTLLQDLRSSRVISQMLPVQLHSNSAFEHVLFISTSGLVVSYPPIPDDKLASLLQVYAASPLMQSTTVTPQDRVVSFTAIQAKLVFSGERLLFTAPVLLNGATRGAVIFDVPQQKLQDYMYTATPPDELHVLLDSHGSLIASNEETFKALKGNWLNTLSERDSGLSIPAMLQTKKGVLNGSEGYFLYQQLPDSGLMLVNRIPINALRWSVISQFSTLFIFIWLSLGLLLAVTLFVVDHLLLSQISLNTQLKELGLVDNLTQLANRRRLQADFKGLVRRFQGKHPIALLMIDIDKFKAINDNWGHSTGDEVLKHLATVCRALVRPQDLVARYGGEEFCVILPATMLAEASDIAEKLRSGIEQSVCMPDPVMMLSTAPSREVRLTVSIGVAELLEDRVKQLEELVAKADRRLYAAKQNGRNRVVSDDSLSSR